MSCWFAIEALIVPASTVAKCGFTNPYLLQLWQSNTLVLSDFLSCAVGVTNLKFDA